MDGQCFCRRVLSVCVVRHSCATYRIFLQDRTYAFTLIRLKYQRELSIKSQDVL